MKYVDEFRNNKLVHKVAHKISSLVPGRNINIMEVCGTHTHNFYRFGLDRLIPRNIKFISGPGCPVCVSPQNYIDAAVELSRDRKNIIVTFGDMLRIPGSTSTLEKERARSGNVRVVYSPLDALATARANPNKFVVFLAVGFETTAPTIALSILAAKKEKLGNIAFLSSLKLIPPAMRYLLMDERIKLDGFICPGHVSVIIGTKSYEFIPKRHKVACCVAGFEPLDILEGIYSIVEQIIKNKPRVANQYKRLVTHSGNVKAQKIIRQIFSVSDSQWRGFNTIPESGLNIRKEFSRFDASRLIGKRCLKEDLKFLKGCRCGDVLKGLILPQDCPLFFKRCRPDNPVGPCMVSSEGACNAYFKFRR
jgi:hydrogenase expression/formation protein HypD